MQRDARTIRSYPLSLSLDGLYQNRTYVTVKVMEGRHELDSFQASSPDVLRDSLRPIFRHLDPSRQLVTFSGTEDKCLPGGLMRSQHEFALPNLSTALSFLAN